MAQARKAKKGFFASIWSFFWGFFWLILATSIFFAVLVVVSYQVIGYWVRGEEIQAPDLTGRSVTDALSDLNANRCSLVLDGWEANDSIGQGEIIKQSPKPGSMIKARTPIKVVVSTGPKNQTIPSTIVGITRREAGLKLRELNLGVSHVAYVRAPGKPNELVLATDPPVGTGVPPRSEIKLLVVSDRPGIQSMVPDLSGLTVDLAKEELRRIGLPPPRVTVVPNEGAQPGTVFRQVPDPGEPIRDTTTVEISISPMKTPEAEATPGPAVGDLEVFKDKASPVPSPERTLPKTPPPTPGETLDVSPDEAEPTGPSEEGEESAPVANPEEEAAIRMMRSRYGPSFDPDEALTPGPLRTTAMTPFYVEPGALADTLRARRGVGGISPELRRLAEEIQAQERSRMTPTAVATLDPVEELEAIVGLASERLKHLRGRGDPDGDGDRPRTTRRRSPSRDGPESLDTPTPRPTERRTIKAKVRRSRPTPRSYATPDYDPNEEVIYESGPEYLGRGFDPYELSPGAFGR